MVHDLNEVVQGIGYCPAPDCEFTTVEQAYDDAAWLVLRHLHFQHEHRDNPTPPPFPKKALVLP